MLTGGLLALATGGRAQVVSQAQGAYSLGAGDVIGIQVINFPELCVPQITVSPDGKIPVPLLKSLTVVGRTTDQVAQTLTTRWTEYVNDPSVTVTLLQKRRQSVQLYGRVGHAQTVEYQPSLHLSAALAQAGGLSDDGDGSRVTVTHGDGTKEVLDLQGEGGAGQDPVLAPDDVVFVPVRHVQVSVLGEVAKPGSYDFKAPMTVLDALKEAGPVNEGTADLSHATLIHDGQETRLDLDGLLRKGQIADNVPLAVGDRIFIPTLSDRIYVFGSVVKPGPYTFSAGDRVLDALKDSGGQAPNADLGKINVIHVDKLKNVATQRTVDIDKILSGKSKGDMSANAALAPGDIVFIPERGQKRSAFDVLAPLGIIGNTVRLLTGF